jgi:hypothetical protein
MATEEQHPDACPECGAIVKSSGLASGVREEMNEHQTCPNGHTLTRPVGTGGPWRLDSRQT